MKFNCSSQDLTKQVLIVEKAVSTRTTIPALKNMFLELNDDILTMRGNDLEIGIEVKLPVEAEAEGIVLLQAKTMSSIVTRLSHGTVFFDKEYENKVVIKSDDVEFDLLNSPINDYPDFPDIESGIQIHLKVEEIQQLIRHTIFAISMDETKPFLKGALVKNESDSLFFVATDGYRLSLKSIPISMPDGDFSAIVPGKALNELGKILQGMPSDEDVTLNISENQVAFVLPNLLFISRVIEGQFPDYKLVLPTDMKYSFKMSRKLFLEACERASIIASESRNVIRLIFGEDSVLITANATTMGEFQESVGVERLLGDGESRIALDVKLILDSIKNLEMEYLELSFNSELSPCVIKPESDPSYTYILMPIRTAEYQPVPA